MAVVDYFYIFSPLFNNSKKIDSQDVTTKMDDFEHRHCAKTQLLYIINTFYMSQMNSKIFSPHTTFSVQL